MCPKNYARRKKLPIQMTIQRVNGVTGALRNSNRDSDLEPKFEKVGGLPSVILAKAGTQKILIFLDSGSGSLSLS
jgi:hypothetical protein